MTAGEAPAVTQLDADDILLSGLSRPVVMPPGHRSRGIPCLMCGDAIGGRAADLLLIWCAEGKVCACGRASVAMFIVHSDCPHDDAGEVVDAAIISQHVHHGGLAHRDVPLAGPPSHSGPCLRCDGGLR